MPLLATILLAAGAGASFPPAGEYRYAASMGGQSIGGWSVSVKEQAGGAQVDETSTATIAGMQMSATASLSLGSDLAPVSYTGSYRVGAQSPNVSVTLTPSSATVIAAMSSEPRRLSLAANTRHFVVIEPGLLAGLFVLPAQLGAWRESSVTWITPATGQGQPLVVGSAANASRPSGVPSQDSVLSVDQPIALTIWYDPATLVPDEVIVPSQGAVLTRIRS